jgi:hypothetical protein
MIQLITSTTGRIIVVLLAVSWSVPAPAQDASPPATPPPTDPAGAPKQDEKKPPPPSLDDLLGLDEEEPDDQADAADEAARRQQEEELARKLNEAKIGEAFEQAIREMALSADLLDQRFDPGLGTQRVQEQILSRLDQLIDQAKKQQASSSSSNSSSSSSQSQSQPPPADGSRPQDGQASGQRPPDATNSQEGDPPPREDGSINTVLEETRQEWGNLPVRVRDMLLQGRQEKFSSLYRRLTEEYYRRLAEEGSP